MTNLDEQARLWRARDLLKQAQLALPVSGVGTYAPANKAISRAMRKIDKQIARLTVEYAQHMGAPAMLPVPKRTIGKPDFGDISEDQSPDAIADQVERAYQRDEQEDA